MGRFKAFVTGSIVVAAVFSGSVAFAKPLSEQQWRKQANVFCRQSNNEFKKIIATAFAGLGPNDQPSAEQNAAFAEAAAPSIARGVASIDALKEPKALKRDVAKWLALGKKAAAGMTANPGPENDAQFAKVNRLGKRLGLVCGG